VLERCRKRIDGIAVDRTKLKPVVKIIGEFWAQTTESSGNYQMFDSWSGKEHRFNPRLSGPGLPTFWRMQECSCILDAAWILNAQSPHAGIWDGMSETSSVFKRSARCLHLENTFIPACTTRSSSRSARQHIRWFAGEACAPG